MASGLSLGAGLGLPSIAVKEGVLWHAVGAVGHQLVFVLDEAPPLSADVGDVRHVVGDDVLVVVDDLAAGHDPVQIRRVLVKRRGERRAHLLEDLIVLGLEELVGVCVDGLRQRARLPSELGEDLDEHVLHAANAAGQGLLEGPDVLHGPGDFAYELARLFDGLDHLTVIVVRPGLELLAELALLDPLPVFALGPPLVPEDRHLPAAAAATAAAGLCGCGFGCGFLFVFFLEVEVCRREGDAPD